MSFSAAQFRGTPLRRGRSLCCAVPGCGRAIDRYNSTGVCRVHNHAAGYCGCAQCQRVGQRAALPVAVDADDVAVVQAARGLEPDVVGCRALWATVLENAIWDALVPLSDMRPVECRAAVDWIGGREFFMVCALVGLDGQYVLRKLGPEIAARRADVAAGRYHASTRAVGVRGAPGIKRRVDHATGVVGVRGAA